MLYYTYVNTLRTRTRFLVLDIWASNGTSWYWLIELAAPDTRPVPTLQSMNVTKSKGAGAIA